MTFKSVCAFIALALLSGCATSRSVVTLADTKGPAAVTTAQPSNGPAVRIVNVEDKRVFVVQPKTPNLPSLQDGAIDNKSITSRAIARKRSGYGQGLGDVLLPEGDTVVNHVTAALAEGFRQAGYRVLSPSDPGYDEATPVNAQILQYWTYMHVAFSHLTLQCDSEIQFDTTLPALKSAPKVTASVTDGMMMVFESDWQAVASKGLQNLSTKLAERLKANKTTSRNDHAVPAGSS